LNYPLQQQAQMRIRRILAISVIFLASSLPLFFSGFFLSSRLVIRKLMLERVETEQLTTIKIPEKEIEWYNPGYEIIIEGKMFDIKSIHLEDGIYTISGLFDEDETELNNLQEDFASQEGHSKKTSHQIFQNCLGIIAITNELTPIPNALQKILEKSFFHYTSPIAKGYKQCVELPPNIRLT
jgi:hypothetical protein